MWIVVVIYREPDISIQNASWQCRGCMIRLLVIQNNKVSAFSYAFSRANDCAYIGWGRKQKPTKTRETSKVAENKCLVGFLRQKKDCASVQVCRAKLCTISMILPEDNAWLAIYDRYTQIQLLVEGMLMECLMLLLISWFCSNLVTQCVTSNVVTAIVIDK